MGAIGADEQPALVVEVADCALDEPALATEPGAVLGLTTRDHRLDPPLPELPAVLVVVVTAIGDQPLRPLPRPSDASAHAGDRVDERQQLGDIVAVRRGRRPGERQPTAVGQDVVLDAFATAVDRARAEPGAPFFACT